MSALLLTFLLVTAFAACNKKEQSQNQPPAATTSEPSSAQGNQPANNMSQAQQPAAGQQQQQQMAQQSAPAQQQQMAQAPAVQPAPAPAPPPPPPPPLVIPNGTGVVIRMGNTIDTKSAQPGDSFTGTLAQAIAVKGVVVVPAGAGVSGTVVDSKSPGRFKGAGDLAITLTSINVHGVPTTIRTSTYTQTIKGKGKRTAVMAGGGTGAGALIGGLAGGGKGALIGGLIGAGAGTAGAAFTGNKDLQVPAETVLTFRLAHSLTVNQPASNQ
jgi:hypothetical protein